MLSISQIAAALEKSRVSGARLVALCPAHHDTSPSLSVSIDNGKLLVKCHAGCSQRAVLEKFKAMGLYDVQTTKTESSLIATYSYHDENGCLLYEIRRLINGSGRKSFQCRRPVNGEWVYNLNGVDRVLYRLPELLKALDSNKSADIFICEGEKDCDTLHKFGLTATTNPGGAGKWNDDYVSWLFDAGRVFVLPDNDEPGAKHGLQVAASLERAGVDVRIVTLPNLPKKGDVTDWLEAGGTCDGLIALCNQTEKVMPVVTSEASSIISVAEATMKQFSGWMDPEPIDDALSPVLPLVPELIPLPFRDFVADVSYRMGCPPDFVAVAVLVVASSILGTGCAVRPKRKDDWLVYPNLWGAVVGRPGMMKSPSISGALGMMRKLELKAAKIHQEEKAIYDAEMEAYNARKSVLKDEMKQIAKAASKGTTTCKMDAAIQKHGELRPPEEPARRRYLTNDSTVPKLHEIQSKNPRGVLVFRDELPGLLSHLDEKGNEEDRAYYLEGWEGNRDHALDRIGRGSLLAKNTISVFGGIQPSKMLRYLCQAISTTSNDGLTQRLQLIVFPDEPLDFNVVDAEPDSQASADVYQILETLSETDFEGMATGSTRSGVPYFQFDDEAQDFFFEWYSELEQKLRITSEHPVIVEHLSKYRSLMPSLSLVFHVSAIASGIGPSRIRLDTVKMSAAWCDYLESHARRLYGLVLSGQKAKAKLAEKIKKGVLRDGFTVRDIYKNEWSLLDTADRAEAACEGLVQSGWIKPVDTSSGSNGGRPTRFFIVNPKVKVNL